MKREIKTNPWHVIEIDPILVPVLFGVIIIVLCFISLIISLNPYGLGEQTTTGVIIAHQQTRSMNNGKYTSIYVKTDGESTIKLYFNGHQELDITIGKIYAITYHTKPWNLVATLDEIKEVI